MWKLALILCLLPSSIVLAGESRAQLHVGFTITDIGNGSTDGRARTTVATGNPRVSIPLPRRRPAAGGPRNTDQ
jgi:hypothetical protein